MEFGWRECPGKRVKPLHHLAVRDVWSLAIEKGTPEAPVSEVSALQRLTRHFECRFRFNGLVRKLLTPRSWLSEFKPTINCQEIVSLSPIPSIDTGRIWGLSERGLAKADELCKDINPESEYPCGGCTELTMPRLKLLIRRKPFRTSISIRRLNISSLVSQAQ